MDKHTPAPLRGLAAVAILVLSASLVYAGSPRIVADDGTYLGTLSTNPYDPDSVSNPYGRYGNPYNPDSINNPYGKYGSPYSPDSVTNPYAIGTTDDLGAQPAAPHIDVWSGEATNE